MKVNGQDASPGCYIAGHHGQYGLDALGDVCDQFGIELAEKDRPSHYRELAEQADEDGDDHSYWEYHHDAANTLEDVLNNNTEGGVWSWEDGEFFLFQTEVEGIVYVRKDVDDGTALYEDAWAFLVQNGVGAIAATNYDDLDNGENYFQFRITVHYEPEDQ